MHIIGVKYFRYNPHRRLSKGVAFIFVGADGSGKSTQISRVVQIFQNKDAAVIITEMIHDARIVQIGERLPLDEKVGL